MLSRNIKNVNLYDTYVAVAKIKKTDALHLFVPPELKWIGLNEDNLSLMIVGNG